MYLQTLSFEPLPEHDKGKLYCSYIQRNKASASILFPNNEVHESLRVIYLKEPKEPLQNFGPIQAMTDWNVTIEFGAHPAPQAQDVIWAFKSDIRTIEVPTESNNVATKGHYLAYPIQRLGENLFSATLTIQNIQVEEQDLEHYLMIRNPELDYSQEHHYTFTVSEQGKSQDSSVGNEGLVGSGTGTTIVVVIVVLVLALIITGALVFYAKKQGIWCFVNKVDTTPEANDPEMQRAFETTEPNMPPIVKRDYRRPTAL